MDDFDVCIGDEDYAELDGNKSKVVQVFIKSLNEKRTPEQKQRTIELGEKYKREDENED